MPTPVPTPAPTPPPASVDANAIYADQCESCHGANGSGPIPLVACTTCGDLGLLTELIAAEMPPASPSSCTGACATALAEKVQNDFNTSSPETPSFSFSAFNILSWEDTLRKTLLNLGGRLASSSEIQQVATLGESGFDSVLDTMMQEDAFYARLREIFNDRWLVHQFIEGTNAVRELPNAAFPNRFWYEQQGYNEDQERLARSLTNEALAEEILYLVEYIVRNDRPMTDILTADYTVVNPFSARAYGVFEQVSFSNGDDANEWRRTRLAQYPHAGILTAPLFLARYPTTNTNKNRHRAYIIYLYLLDTDVLAAATRPSTTASEGKTNPTLDDPNCNVCHNVIDPVAQLFSNFQTGVRYLPNRTPFADMLDAGIGSLAMPDSQDDTRLQWLGSRIADDPRFARAMLATLYTALTGHQPLAPSANNDANALAAYNAQRTVFSAIESAFIESDFNLKTMLKALVKTPYFRIDGLVSGADEALYSSSSTSHMLTPEQLHRKLYATTGKHWMTRTTNVLTSKNYYRDIYGGINSADVTERNYDPNGLVVSVQARMANQMSCQLVAQDFFAAKAERGLFPLVELNTVSRDSSGNVITGNRTLIRDNIRHLQQLLLGEVDTTLTTDLLNTFMLVQSRGLELIAQTSSHRDLPTECRVTQVPGTTTSLPTEERIVRDANYTIRSWMAVLRVMLNEYQYLYE